MNRAWHLAPALLVFLLTLWFCGGVGIAEKGAYVGSKACKDCHEEQYTTFMKFAKKAKSDHSVQIMASDLSPEEIRSCYPCHTTGYGQPGGFKSYQETPDMGHAGCEVCHGPGAAHVEGGGDPTLIRRKMSMKECEVCHNAERVKSFNFKPLLHGGAH